MANIFSHPVPKSINESNRPQHISWGSLPGSSSALAIASAAQSELRPIVVITPDSPSAMRLEQEIRFFLKTSDGEHPHVPVGLFPDWETLPYDQFSPN